MPVPKNKQELLLEIETTYSKLKKELVVIPVELTSKRELEGHAKETKMSVSNLVSYLIGWGELVLKWNRKKENNEETPFPDVDFKWNELGKLAQKFYSDYEKHDYPTLLKKLDEVVAEIVSLINCNSNKDLYEKPWYRHWTKGKMIQLNTSSPYKNARIRLRKWKKLQA